MPGDMMNTSWSDLLALGVAVSAALYWLWLRATRRISTRGEFRELTDD